MLRICFVVQRFGKDIVGGSEQLARCYTELLKEDFEVHVVTSCAVDHITWRNQLPAGTSQEEGIWIHRFPSDFEREEYWHQIHYLLLLRPILSFASFTQDHEPVQQWPLLWSSDGRRKQLFRDRAQRLPRAVQEEFVRYQGPYSTKLLEFIEKERDNFDLFLFFTYLYPTTYFGAPLVSREKRILVPTLHDEPYAYMPIYGELMNQFDRLIFLSPGEKLLARQLYDLCDTGTLIGMPVENLATRKTPNPYPGFPYILYCGRIEGAKGTNALFEYFLRYKSEYRSDLKLILTGHAAEPIPEHPDIRFLGFVEEEDKFSLMQHALLFVQPSPFESFSIVLLEAFLSRTPAVVNADSVVLREHCRMANAGLYYTTYDEFAECLSMLVDNAGLRHCLGENGRKYVQENYSREVVSRTLRDSLQSGRGTTVRHYMFCCPRCKNHLQLVATDLLSCDQCSLDFPRVGEIWQLFDKELADWNDKLKETEGWVELHKKKRIYDQTNCHIDFKLPYFGDGDWPKVAKMFDQALELVDAQRPSTILEIGAMRGWASKHFALRGYQVFALDTLVDDQIGLGRARALMRRSETAFTLVQADMENLPFAPRTFEMVFACGVLHHSARLLHLFTEVYRVLKVDGFLLAINEPCISVGEDPTGHLRQLEEIAHGIKETRPNIDEYLKALTSSGLKPGTVCRYQDFDFEKIRFTHLHQQADYVDKLRKEGGELLILAHVIPNPTTLQTIE